MVEVAFGGGDIVGDGSVVLLRQVDERVGLTCAATRVFVDSQSVLTRRSGHEAQLLLQVVQQRLRRPA